MVSSIQFKLVELSKNKKQFLSHNIRIGNLILFINTDKSYSNI
jgi:hypothetical protein